MRWPAFVFASTVVASLGAQQEPAQHEPLDLEAIARQLELPLGKGELPSVRAAIRAEDLQRLDELGGLLSPADVEELLLWPQMDTAWFAAAVRVLAQPDAERDTAAGLHREIVACIVLESAASSQAFLDGAMGGAEKPRWFANVATPAQQRSRGLGVRLLREHRDDPLVGDYLLRIADEVEGFLPSRLRAEGLRRLGPRVSSVHRWRCAAASLGELDIDAAAASLELGSAARSPAQRAGRRLAADMAFDLRRRIAAAKVLAVAQEQPGLEGQVAHLRLLQVAGGDAAIDECRRLVAAEFAHALPYSVLAATESVRGRADEGASLLVKSAALPGRDAHTVAAMFLSRVFPLLRQRANSPAEREKVETDVEALVVAADAILAPDSSEEARTFAWLRKELDWPMGVSRQSMGRSLSAAVALQSSLPESRSAYEILLAAAALTEDRDAALLVLQRPVPAALANLHDLALLRASLCVRRHLLEARAPQSDPLDRILADLERVQGDARDACYLRGVLRWSQAMRPGTGADELRAARDLFAAAQRSPGEPGWWRAACALCVANAALGEKEHLDDLLARRDLRDSAQPHLGLSLVALLSTVGDAPESLRAGVQRLVTMTEQPTELAVLHAATAVGCRERGDLDGAKKSATLALQAIAGLEPDDLRHDCGVWCEGRFAFNFGIRQARLEVVASLKNDFWVLPRLPPRALLQQLADDR